MIKICNLTKTYGSKIILDDMNLEINKGDFIHIYGKSGQGKSTLLNIIGLMDNNYKGNVFIEDNNIKKMSDLDKSKLRATKVGYIFQSYNLIDYMNVYENICMGVMYGKKKGISEQYIEDIMRKLEIYKLKDVYIQYLSGGEKQRVSIARTMAMNPDIVLADEPTGNLDDYNADIIYEYFKESNKNNKTLLVVSHDKSKMSYSNRYVYMDNGVCLE